MKHLLRIPGEIQVLIRHLAPELKQRIRIALEEVSQNPQLGKQLIEELQGLRTYKVGQLRIVYREGNIIEIVGIGPRKTIYQKVALELKRGNRV